jgi:hypothetical protein
VLFLDEVDFLLGEGNIQDVEEETNFVTAPRQFEIVKFDHFKTSLLKRQFLRSVLPRLSSRGHQLDFSALCTRPRLAKKASPAPMDARTTSYRPETGRPYLPLATRMVPTVLWDETRRSRAAGATAFIPERK